MYKSIDVCRQDYINNMIEKFGNTKVKYIGEVEPDDIDPEQLNKFKQQHKGSEIVIEYHMFEIIESGIPIVLQWRLV